MAYYNKTREKKLNSQFRQINNKIINDALKTNYKKQLIYDGTKYFKNGNPLLSWSSLTKSASEVAMYKIPNDILTLLSYEGQSIMYYLEMVANREVKNLQEIDYASEKLKKMFYALMQCFIDNELKIVKVEKHIANDYWHGYIDCIVRQPNGLLSIVEIKTRSKYEIRDTDLAQLGVYNAILSSTNLAKILIIINRRTFCAQAYKIPQVDCRKQIKKINTWLELMNMSKYKLTLGTKEKEND